MADVKIKAGKLRIKGNHPIKWDEVSPRQFCYIAKYFNGNTDDPARRIALFFDLLGLSKRQRRRMPNFDEDDNTFAQSIIDAMLQLGRFLNEEPETPRWFMPFVWIGLKRYFAPRPDLSGSSFDEFMYIDTHYQMFFDNHSGENLWKMASVLYRPAGNKMDDIRAPFDEKNFNVIADRWKKVNGYILEAIMYNYMQVRRNIERMYPHLFPEAKPQDPDAEIEMPTEPVWLSSLDALCDGDLVKMKAYGADDMHNVLRQLDKKMAEKR